jgi:hypothetical protein
VAVIGAPWYLGGWPVVDAALDPNFGSSGSFAGEALPPANEWNPPQAGSDAGQYWYYCSDPVGYYPYVQTCKVPWLAVSPYPAAGSAPAK